MYRAISAAPNKKAYWYQCAKNEFNFVLARVQKPFVLHAELLFNMGISTLSAGQETEGVQYLTMALEIDPTFVPAYAALSDFFEVRGDSAQAAAIAETGLSHAPNSDVLRDKLLALQARAGDPTSGDDGP